MPRKFNFSKLILILIIPFIILLISFYITAFNQEYYIKQFEKNNVYDDFNLSKTELHKINDILLEYLHHGNREFINTTLVDEKFFNEKEKIHLLEVKELMQSLFILFYFFLTVFILLCFIVYFRNKKKIIKNLSLILISGGILNIIFILIFGGLMLTDFSNSFTKFHLVFFKSDTWLLNPLTDNLIKMFPAQFFYDISFRILSNSVIYSVVLVLILLYVYRKIKD